MSLLRTSRLAAHMTKEAILGLAAKGLWGAAKGVGSAVKSFGILPTAGLVGGPIAAGMGAHEALKGAKEDMSAEGFGKRMGYGG